MATSTYQAGEVVQLRNGGPPMTIKSFEMLDSTPFQGTHLRDDLAGVIVRCIWHDDKGQLREGMFPPHVITHPGRTFWQTQALRTGQGIGQQELQQQRYGNGSRDEQYLSPQRQQLAEQGNLR